MKANPVILALDFNQANEAIDFVKSVKEEINWVKVGMELFYAEGPSIIKELKKHQLNIFLDLKLNDIPNTVSRSMLSLAKLDVDMLNLHITSGIEAMKKASQTLKQTSKPPLLIGVTVLTSLEEADLRALNVNKHLDDQVYDLAVYAYQAGLDGVVCSALEASQIKKITQPSFLTVCPGIRLNSDSKDDQKRIVTPNEAIKNQADFIVIGRSVTQAKNPIEQIKTIKREINNA